MKHAKELKIGLFVVVIMVASFFLINYLRGEDIFNKEYEVVGRYPNVEGLVASSPVFVKEQSAGTILCIPTIFVSYTGEALDKKTPLLRSIKELSRESDPERIWHLKRRIAELTPMLTECNALAKICEHYYEPGFYRDDAYCFPKDCRRKPAGKPKNIEEDIHGIDDLGEADGAGIFIFPDGEEAVAQHNHKDKYGNKGDDPFFHYSAPPAVSAMGSRGRSICTSPSVEVLIKTFTPGRIWEMAS